MFYYTLKDNKIEQFAEIANGDIVPAFMQEWLKTEDKIIRLVDFSLAFEKDVDMQEQARLKAEQERVIEEAKQREAEKPTTEDLVEALDILSNIVLGGAE